MLSGTSGAALPMASPPCARPGARLTVPATASSRHAWPPKAHVFAVAPIWPDVDHWWKNRKQWVIDTRLERRSSANHTCRNSATSETNRPGCSAFGSDEVEEIDNVLRRPRADDVIFAPHQDRAVSLRQKNRFSHAGDFKLAISAAHNMKERALPRYTHCPWSAELRTIILARSNTDAANYVIEQRPSPRIDLKFHRPVHRPPALDN